MKHWFFECLPIVRIYTLKQLFKVKFCRVHSQAFFKIHVGVQKERRDAFYSQNIKIEEINLSHCLHTSCSLYVYYWKYQVLSMKHIWCMLWLIKLFLYTILYISLFNTKNNSLSLVGKCLTMIGYVFPFLII